MVKRGQLEKIALPSKKGFYYFKITDIVYFQSDGNFCFCYSANGQKHSINLMLKDIESRLGREGFCRIHHSYLINLYHLERFNKIDGNYVQLSTTLELPVSRAKKSELMKMVGM